MKKILLLLLIFCSTGHLFAQVAQQIKKSQITTNNLGQKVTTSHPIRFHITPPLSEWKARDVKNKGNKKTYNRFKHKDFTKKKGLKANDPVVQSNMGAYTFREPIISFDGQQPSEGSSPPDPTGAAGPNHYVQAVNTTFRVYDKEGNPLSTPLGLNSLWPGTTNDGDPVVMYDRHADRWLISQFQGSPNRLLTAISTSSDPLGSYYSYEFICIGGFPDYPKYSIWWDGYYVGANYGLTFSLERQEMLVGNPNAQIIEMNLPGPINAGLWISMPSDADGSLPPNGTPCNFFLLEDDFSNTDDLVRVYEMSVDWDNTSNSQIILSKVLPLPPYDGYFEGGLFQNISQPNTTNLISALPGFLMYRAQHMRWVTHNSILLSHVVNMGENKAAVRWYELRDAQDGNWEIYQSGTYAPDNTDRWMSSLAMDDYGNIALAYSVCSASENIYPGIRYTGRLQASPLGEMTIEETTAISGEASLSTTHRYGDYSHLSLDPDGETFWYTGEYIGVGGEMKTRIFSFTLNDVLGLENQYYRDLKMQAIYFENGVKASLTGIQDNEELTIDLIGMNGGVIQSEKKMPLNQKVEKRFYKGFLSPGIYFIRIRNENFQKVKRIVFN